MIPREKLKALDLETLKALNTAVAAEIAERTGAQQRHTLTSFRIGDKVTWTSPRTRGQHAGQTVVATVESVNTKSVSCRDHATQGLWRVSPGLLRKI
jgi:hypothetical protein